jgi:zinc protease
MLLGTQSFTKQQIEENIESLGAVLNFGASLETANLSASFHKKDWNTVFPIIQEVLMSPAFDSKEFDKMRNQYVQGLKRSRESPRSVIGQYFNTLMFEGHPYANPVSGLISVVEDITIDDVQSFYNQYYKPNHTAIAIVGDFETGKMKAWVIEAFKNWQQGQSVPTLPEVAGFPEQSQVLLVNKDDSHETTFYIGQKGIKRSNPDYVELQVINTILGGRFTSWLNSALRINTGLSYGARSSFRSYSRSGTFVMSSFTATPTTFEAIDLALQVYDSLHMSGIDAKTLASAEQYVKGQFPPRYETSGDLAGFLLDMHVYGFDKSLINDFQQKVDALTLERANDLIQQYFPSTNLQFVLIGKASVIREKAAHYGDLMEKEILEDGF